MKLTGVSVTSPYTTENFAALFLSCGFTALGGSVGEVDVGFLRVHLDLFCGGLVVDL